MFPQPLSGPRVNTESISDSARHSSPKSTKWRHSLNFDLIETFFSQSAEIICFLSSIVPKPMRAFFSISSAFSTLAPVTMVMFSRAKWRSHVFNGYPLLLHSDWLIARFSHQGLTPYAWKLSKPKAFAIFNGDNEPLLQLLPVTVLGQQKPVKTG